MKRLILTLGTVYLMASLSACGLASSAQGYSSTSELNQINVVAQIGANQNTATALDVVFVFDKNALSVLPRTGPDWFANKSALGANLASGVAVVSLQIPPGSTVSVEPMPKGYEKAVAVYSYANYVSADGQAMGNITSFKCARLTLTSTQISYSHCR